MASVTLAESAKLGQDMLVQGVIEDIITVDKMYEMMPFDGINGNAIAYNRENALGDVTAAGVGDTFTALGAGKAAATFTQVNSNLTTIMGNAEVNGLIQASRSVDNDQTGVQISSKAKAAGREYRRQVVNGTGSSNEFNGLINLCAAGQTVNTGTNGSALTFAILDEMTDFVVDKDGEVDYILMNARTIRSYRVLLRALGGAGISDVATMPSGATVPSYNGIPIFRNDYVPINQTKGSSTNCSTIFAGTFDDGSRTHGIAGLTATNEAGISVVDAGEKEDADEHIWRIRWYCGMALFSEKGLACADGITD